MINNIDRVLSLLVFDSDDDFYYLQILQRKKENPEVGSNSRVIKNYYITSIDYLLKRKDEIISLCNIFNARAYLRLNKRSFKRVAFKTMQNIANTMSNGEFQFIRSSYDRACGLGHNDKNKKWILDIDTLDNYDLVNEIRDVLNIIEPKGDKIIKILNSKNGCHLITKPFNTQEFCKEYPEINIHKDNPTNLYIP